MLTAQEVKVLRALWDRGTLTHSPWNSWVRHLHQKNVSAASLWLTHDL